MTSPARLSLFATLLLSALPVLAAGQPVDIQRRPRQFLRSHDYDVQHYRIQLAIDEASRTVHGETTVTLRALADDFRTCILDAETFAVSAVRDEWGSPLEFQQTPGSLAVQLARPYRHGETVGFTVTYRLVNPQVDSTKFGMEPSYRLGLDFKDPGARNPRMVSTLSFPQGARHWFPAYDDPDDKATADIIVTARHDHTVVSNGRLVSVTTDEKAGTRTFHWSQQEPHSTFLFMVAAGPYVVVRDSLDSLPISYWVYPEDAPHARRTFGRTPEVIRFFNERYGYPYPWAKYDQVIIPGIGGGAESTTATVIGESAISTKRRPGTPGPSCSTDTTTPTTTSIATPIRRERSCCTCSASSSARNRSGGRSRTSCTSTHSARPTRMTWSWPSTKPPARTWTGSWINGCASRGTLCSTSGRRGTRPRSA
jgi:aminopeptidase N